jgi:hypothetical protein
MAGCSLRLGQSPFGASPLPTVRLAGQDWKVPQIQPKLLHYSAVQDYSSFLLGSTLSDPYKGSAKDSCQQAAEDVLKTVSVALPHSTKGYELYSWYEEREGQCFYALGTGQTASRPSKSFVQESTVYTQAAG